MGDTHFQSETDRLIEDTLTHATFRVLKGFWFGLAVASVSFMGVMCLT